MTRVEPQLHEARPLRILLGWLHPFRWRIVGASLAFVAKDSPFWLLPIVTANIIDAVVKGNGWHQLLVNGGIALGVVLLNFPANSVWVRLYARVVRELGADLRNALAHRLQELSIGFHARSNSSIVQTKVIRDVENLELMLQQTLGPLLSASSILVGAAVTTALRVPSFLIVFVVTVPLGVVLVRWLRSRSRQRNEDFRRRVEGLSSRVGEMSSLLQLTRAHGLEYVAADRVAESARAVRDAGFQLDRLNGRFGALSWASYQVLGLACLVGASAAAMSGLIPITPGEVVLLSTYFAILTQSITATLGLAPIATRGFESVRSINEVLLEPDLELNEGRAIVGRVTGDLNFAGVSYDYGDGTGVSGIDLHIEPGETVAFVGPSGSGKSTILNLALGFLRPTRGVLSLDGVDIEELDLRSARRFISVVPQDSVLFEGSVRENIEYGLDGISDERVRAALDAANALEFVEELPLGWDTTVGERGSGLSGGQRQRLAIARALIRDPRILLLDEATSALDPESEAAVRVALDRLMEGRTSLVVAHRLATVRFADRIVVLEKGGIVEIGSHDELIALNGTYARLHRVQAG